MTAPAIKDNSTNILLVLITYIGLESIYHIFLSKVIGPAVNNGYINRDIETIYNFSFWITNVSWIALTITLAVISKSSNVRTGLIVLSLLTVLRVLVYRVFA